MNPIPFASIQALADDIAKQFQPQKIILFGSQAYGVPVSEDSDVDMLILMPYQGPSYRQASKIRSAMIYDFPLDLIIKTPEEAQSRYQQADPLITAALDHGTVLYEKSSDV